MVSRITFGSSIRRAFSYNENKLDLFFTDQNGNRKPSADLLLAENYPLDLAELTKKQRLDMLLKTAQRAPDCKLNTLHIFLSFAPGEHLPPEKLRAIAKEYMQGIGFSAQPYLVYQHHDTAHPHLHLVTLKVRPNGKLIDTFRIGKRKSEPTRIALEQKYGLVKAQDHHKGLYELPALKVTYGKTETKNGISHVLDRVLPFYNFTSLTELNAILKRHNVIAHQGKPGGRIERNGGMLYQVLDQGKPAGPAIKASAFYSAPILTELVKRFKSNELLREKNHPAFKSGVTKLKAKISLALKKHYPDGTTGLQNELLKSGIDTVISQNDQGRNLGIIFVDREKRLSIKGSDLGKSYSLMGIANRLNQPSAAQNLPHQSSVQAHLPPSPHLIQFFQQLFTIATQDLFLHPYAGHEPAAHDNGGLLEVLLKVEHTYQITPPHLKNKRKKKRKKRNTNT